jgi:hypothetical protein
MQADLGVFDPGIELLGRTSPPRRAHPVSSGLKERAIDFVERAQNLSVLCHTYFIGYLQYLAAGRLRAGVGAAGGWPRPPAQGSDLTRWSR